MESTINENNDLKLDVESVNDRLGVTSSLTDINQVPVFSSYFQEKKEQYLEDREKVEESLSQNVFYIQPKEEQTDEVIEKLFAGLEDTTIIRDETGMIQGRSYPVMSITLFTAAVFLTAILLSHKKRSKGHDADNQPGHTV